MREVSPGIALPTLTSVRYRAQFLEDFPRGGRPIDQGHRTFRIYGTPDLIRYRTVDAVLKVIRVDHERKDWQPDP